MPEWEYCTVVSDQRRAVAVFHTPDGRRTEPITGDAGEGDADGTEAWSRYVAALGLDGWELVGAESPAAHALELFFKRPVGGP